MVQTVAVFVTTALQVGEMTLNGYDDSVNAEQMQKHYASKESSSNNNKGKKFQSVTSVMRLSSSKLVDGGLESSWCCCLGLNLKPN